MMTTLFLRRVCTPFDEWASCWPRYGVSWSLSRVLCRRSFDSENFVYLEILQSPGSPWPAEKLVKLLVQRDRMACFHHLEHRPECNCNLRHLSSIRAYICLGGEGDSASSHPASPDCKWGLSKHGKYLPLGNFPSGGTTAGKSTVKKRCAGQFSGQSSSTRTLYICCCHTIAHFLPLQISLTSTSGETVWVATAIGMGSLLMISSRPFLCRPACPRLALMLTSHSRRYGMSAEARVTKVAWRGADCTVHTFNVSCIHCFAC